MPTKEPPADAADLQKEKRRPRKPATERPQIFSDIERVDAQEQRALQENLVTTQIDYVRGACAFFARRLGDEPIHSLEDLAQLPFVTKAELLAAQADDRPLGDVAGAPPEQLVRLHVTSGTTATPLMIGFTRRDLAHATEAGARAFWAAGARARAYAHPSRARLERP